MILTNISTYKEISEEAYLKMKKISEENRSPKPDGNEGWVIKYDSTHQCFKQAMISTVFTGMWLEALLHQKIIEEFGEAKFKEYDFKSYEEKLKLFGFVDEGLTEKVTKFRKSRKELVHEKAYTDSGEIKTAQEEAENARHLFLGISQFFDAQHS